MSKFSKKQLNELSERVSLLNKEFKEIQKTFPFVDKFTCHKLDSKYIVGYEITID
ncbi:hypothetical protein [Polaribacter sp. SA4-12]|uniref:hypothetical protein n=1 Tax=Polaribacter sp. SA4-12 TaxID=1312072 RepID=UPI0012F97E4A|nr:hypothetical protein [Polaribacter sp. SA4-12]